ncbi:fumarylacetoacetate hydrolase family protein [Achromobacter aloeverae]
MKLLSYFHKGVHGWGALSEDGAGVVDLGRRKTGFTSVLQCLESDAVSLPGIRRVLSGRGADHGLSDVQLDIPIARPGKILCIGVNYARRQADYTEYKENTEAPAYPNVFLRVPASFVAHGADLLLPPESGKLDYEGEIGLVIGRGGRRIPREQALSHIAGVTCVNEGTIRDWTKHGKFNVTQGKNWTASGSIGPWIATADEFSRGYGDIRVQTRVNGETRQDDSTRNLIFDFAFLIHYLSTFTDLAPGDIIATGTPVGTGARRDPPVFLRERDVVEVEVSGVGVLRNSVRNEV